MAYAEWNQVESKTADRLGHTMHLGALSLRTLDPGYREKPVCAAHRAYVQDARHVRQLTSRAYDFRRLPD